MANLSVKKRFESTGRSLRPANRLDKIVLAIVGTMVAFGYLLSCSLAGASLP